MKEGTSCLDEAFQHGTKPAFREMRLLWSGRLVEVTLSVLGEVERQTPRRVDRRGKRLVGSVLSEQYL